MDGEQQTQQQGGISSNIKAINTTVMLLSQKISYLVRNEKILSQNILVLNDKIKKLDEKMSSGSFGREVSGIEPESFEDIKSQVTELSNKINETKEEIENIRKAIENLRDEFVSRKEFQEMKYLVDSINPLEFVTYKQLKEFRK